MAFTRYQILLSIVMVSTGTINTLSAKWSDHLTAKGSDGKIRKYDHPFVQAAMMFFGEILCLLAFKIIRFYYVRKQIPIEDVEIIRGNQNFSPFIFLPAAMLDMVASSLMMIGLELTNAPSFQMLRGSVIIFVALLSSGFVGREIKRGQWTGIFLTIVGLSVVGLSDVSPSGHDRNSIITGDLLIVMAQILTACQMVYEEKFVVDRDIPPLQAVGWEGVFGFSVLTILLLPLYFIKAGPPFAYNAGGVLEDLPDAIVQMSNNFWIVFASLSYMLSIAFFNFAGISMTKEISATTRMILDSMRTFFIWAFSLAVRWQNFYVAQCVGFFVLFLGMCVYYDILPSFLRRNAAENDDEEPVINRADEA